MELFTKEDKARIASRISKNPAFVEMIENKTRDVRNKLYIQKTGLATWSHYFSCPVCGAKLIFNYYDNEHFECKNCGAIQSGEPYLGAWWESVLDITTTSAKLLAIGYVGTGREDMLSLAKEILLGYADNYKNYEVHGGIPYNNPGRFASQVLSDAHPIYELSLAYSLVKEYLCQEEREHIENDLFRPAAEHQIKYLTPQIHNHEVIICTSIAAIGMAIGDETLVKFARDEKYGLKYQIDNAYLEDNFWFECSTGYHLYSLRWFIIFEMLTKNTEYGLFKVEHYREKLYRALLFPKNLYIGDGGTVKFNDGGGSLRGHGGMYEYPYALFGTDELRDMITESYVDSDRRFSVDALLWGVDELPLDAEPLKKQNYISTVGTHLALLHGTEDRYFAFKALPYGGEHDHYDRLSISFDAFGAALSPDMGTSSGYGSPLHYGYFKNTASHNTVVIDGENMAPCDTKVNEYRVNAPDDIYLDAETLPPEEYKMLDSFTIKQWSDEAYAGVRMRRVISWHDKYFVDVFSVKSENELKKEYTLHLNARHVSPREGRYVNGINNNGAQSYIKNGYIAKRCGVSKLHYTQRDVNVDVYAEASGLELIFAEGPNNPADKKISYLLERSTEKSPTFVNVIETYRDESVIDSVKIERLENEVKITVTEKSGKVRNLAVKL